MRFLRFPTPLYDAEGALAGALNMLVGGTDRRATESALRESEELNRRMLESSRDCIKLLDVRGRLLSINDFGLRVLEVQDFKALRGVAYCELWTGDTRAAADAAVDEARRGEAPGGSPDAS